MRSVVDWHFVAGALLTMTIPIAAAAQTGAISSRVPDAVDPDGDYIIYLHGRIIEVEGRRPTHPTFGVYEYDAILEDFADRGFNVISEVRPETTQVGDYAETAADQVRQLVEAGVAPGRVTVVGFSKGGMITIATSSTLRMPGIGYVILAGCNNGVFQNTGLTLTGRILSIHEASDNIGISCVPLFDRSPDATSTAEHLIDTGERHGAFYRPTNEWLDPIFEWIGRS
jgi:predicted esterase